MIRFLKLLGLALVLIVGEQALAQDPNFHIYLCLGQSNMEGSASIEAQDRTVDSRFRMMPSMQCDDQGRSMGKWYAAEPPLSQCWAGLSPADYFGRTMIKNLPDSIRVGVIVVAVGGCDIRLFDKDVYTHFTDTYQQEWFQNKIKYYGGSPYHRLLSLAKQARNDGVIKGILLHQGETNTGDEQWPEYVKKVYYDLLADLDLSASEVPLLAGEVGHIDQGGKCGSMNEIIDRLPQVIPTAHVISSRGVLLRSDSIHFNSVGVRELGRRYALKMLQLEFEK